MLPLHRRIAPILGVLVGAPITAEYLYAYLAFTGDPAMSLFAIGFLAPLYGGAALLIREIAVRTRRGWRGILLLAAAFGIAMPGLIDLALLGENRADVAFWSELREPTLLPALGFSVFPLLSWVMGHVVMSIGAPLALLYALAPAHRGRPLLGPIGIPLLAIAAALIAVAIHQDGREIYDYAPSIAQVVAVLAAVGLVGALAFTRLGAPLTAASASRAVPGVAVVVGAVAFKLSTDLLPATWVGVAALLLILAAAGAILTWCARRRRWGPREIGLLGAGVIVAGAAAGFASPTPAGVTLAEKLVHSGVLLTLALIVLMLVVVRTEPGSTDPAPSRRRR